MDFWTRPLLFLPGLTYPQFPNVNLSYSTNSTPVFQSVSLNTCLPPSNNPQGFVPLPTCQQDHPASISCPVQHGKANDIKRLFLTLSRHQKLHDVNDGSDRNWQNDSVTMRKSLSWEQSGSRLSFRIFCTLRETCALDCFEMNWEQCVAACFKALEETNGNDSVPLGSFIPLMETGGTMNLHLHQWAGHAKLILVQRLVHNVSCDRHEF